LRDLKVGIGPVLFCLLSFGFSVWSAQSALHTFRAKDLFSKPPPNIEHFSFGFREPIADSLWVRVIQDFTFCESPKGDKLCRGQDWVYWMLSGISNLAPEFRLPHLVGPMMLTIIVNDIQGASLLFDRAVILFPKDWQILYAASYQAVFEEKNHAKAGDLVLAAAKNGGPTWLYDYANRLYFDAGKKDNAVELMDYVEKNPGIPEGIRENIRKRLKEKAAAGQL